MRAAYARVALTGASGGIGRATAITLLQAGASVMLVGRSPARLSAQMSELMQRFDVTSARVSWHAADLNEAAGIAGLRDSARAWGVNTLVLGAGLPSFGRLESLDERNIANVLQTNLLSPMLLTQALLPHLRSLARAQVLLIGSALGRIGLPGFSVYSASKFGLRGFAEALRRELADSGVRVQYLGPRSTRTAFNDDRVEAFNRTTDTAMDPPERVAMALLQLLEDESAEHFVGFPEALAVRLNGLAPALLDGAFMQHRRSLPSTASHSPTVDRTAVRNDRQTSFTPEP
jgi:short-subunit dehydrogenase